MNDFPAHPDQLTAEWLGNALNCKVNSFNSRSLGEGVGVIGLVNRITLDSPDGPASVIAKFAAAAEANRAVANTYSMYYREYLFYTQVAEHVPVHAPACYHARYNTNTNDFVLLLEDLQGYELGDQIKGCTLEECAQVIETLAAFHRSTWQPDTEIGIHNSPAQVQGMTMGFNMGWPAVKESFPQLVTDDIFEKALPLGDRVEALLARICREPVCISHGDLRLDNVFFAKDDIALVDYQATCLSAPEHDLAYFLTQSLKKNVRNGRDWVVYYHEELTKDGLDYPLETCRERYRDCALYFLCYAAVICSALDLANDRGRKMGETLLGNCLESLNELNAYDILETL